MDGNLVQHFRLVDAVNEKTVTVTRTKKCEWCGAEAEEHIFGFVEDKDYYPLFTQSGFGKVVIAGYETEPLREEYMLCPSCIKKLVSFLEEQKCTTTTA